MTFTIVRVAGRALLRPRLLVPLLATAWRFRRRGWYRQAPFLPLPPLDYLQWRLQTAYGSEQQAPTAAELAAFVEWAARMRSRKSLGDFE